MILEEIKYPKFLWLETPTPFVDCFGKAEREQAAAMIVRSLQIDNRPWGPILPREIGVMLKRELAEAKAAGRRHPWDHPFFRPDFDSLIEAGYARWVEQDGLTDRERPIEMTESAIQILTNGSLHAQRCYRNLCDDQDPNAVFGLRCRRRIGTP